MSLHCLKICFEAEEFFSGYLASHRTPVSVYMVDRSSSGLVNIAIYGDGYQKDEECPINLLFHGYGHYDILESLPDRSNQKLNKAIGN